VLDEDVVGDAAVGEVRRGGYEEVLELDVLGESREARRCRR
jgi:hypothetical protein